MLGAGKSNRAQEHKFYTMPRRPWVLFCKTQKVILLAIKGGHVFSSAQINPCSNEYEKCS